MQIPKNHFIVKVERPYEDVVEVNGKDIPITNEMGEYMLKYVDGVDLGIS